MSWLPLLTALGTVLVTAGVAIWRISAAYAKQLAVEERLETVEVQIQRLRDWKHDAANPMMQAHQFRIEHMEEHLQLQGHRGPYRVAPLPSYTEIEDSRVTQDPRREPKK